MLPEEAEPVDEGVFSPNSSTGFVENIGYRFPNFLSYSFNFFRLRGSGLGTSDLDLIPMVAGTFFELVFYFFVFSRRSGLLSFDLFICEEFRMLFEVFLGDSSLFSSDCYSKFFISEAFLFGPFFLREDRTIPDALVLLVAFLAAKLISSCSSILNVIPFYITALLPLSDDFKVFCCSRLPTPFLTPAFDELRVVFFFVN